MSDFKPKPGSFLPYLQSQRGKSPAPSASATPLTLLEILVQQPQHALPMADLQARSGMPSDRFRESLSSLRDAEYITVEGDPLAAVVKLTGSGEKASRLARSE